MTQQKKLSAKDIQALGNILGNVTELTKKKALQILAAPESQFTDSACDIIDTLFNNSDLIYRQDIRCSLYEKLVIQHNAQVEKGNQSSFIRRCIFSTEVDVESYREAQLNRDILKKLFIEINSIGRNLNQLVKHCNTLASVSYDIDRFTLLAHLQVTHAQLIYVGMIFETLNPCFAPFTESGNVGY